MAAPGLRLVFWESTAGCNLDCQHCRRLDVSRQLMANDMTTDQARAMISDLAAFAKPILVFSGGEPLMRPDIFELAEHARHEGLRAALATNGTLIDREVAQRIRDVGIARVSISVDGADAATHDGFRRQAGSFDLAVAGLKLVRQAGVGTQINCTVARQNADQLDRVLALGESLGVEAVHVFLLVPVGCGQELSGSQMLSADEIEAVMVRLAEADSRTTLQIKATCAPHYYRILRQRGVSLKGTGGGHPGSEQGGMHTLTRGCLAGLAVCFVSHTGEVFPCGYLPVSAGNVLNQQFKDIWADSKVFGELRDFGLLQGRCGACEYRSVCGGCRARGFAEHGSYLAEEPYCNYVPRTLR